MVAQQFKIGAGHDAVKNAPLCFYRVERILQEADSFFASLSGFFRASQSVKYPRNAMDCSPGLMITGMGQLPSRKVKRMDKVLLAFIVS